MSAELSKTLLIKTWAVLYFVQNEVQSSVGRGWKIAGVQRIVNPNDNHLMIEESNGNVSSYYQKDTIKTIANIGTLGGDLKKGVGLVGYPNVQFAKSDGMKFYQANSLEVQFQHKNLELRLR